LQQSERDLILTKQKRFSDTPMSPGDDFIEKPVGKSLTYHRGSSSKKKLIRFKESESP
jgi:hypothetical protein